MIQIISFSKTSSSCTIKGYRLANFILESGPFLEFLEECETKVINPTYAIFERQDNLLISWLLASISPEMLSQLIGCDTAREVWKIVEQIFSFQLKAKVMQYKFKL